MDNQPLIRQYNLVRSGVSFANKPITNEHGFARNHLASLPPRRSVVVLLALWFALSGSPFARADFSMPGVVSAASVSGQFLVTSLPGFSPLAFTPGVTTNENLVRLDPALLAVSADRIRQSLLQKLGVDPSAPWSGKIYLVVSPAQSLDENVEIASSRFEDGWDYHVLLPDILPRDRLARALTGALLLEYANRNATDRSAEVPPWLVEGLSQELLASSLQDVILSAPDQSVNGLPFDNLTTTSHSLDTLAAARAVVQNDAVLTFNQLSWPTDSQLSGDDGGVYRASAQLFVDELLALPNGGAKLRNLLASLPSYYNWQTAFWSAFNGNFSTPLQVEKWWALQTVLFASRSPGQQWTPAASREKLDEILSVTVDLRSSSNSLPTSTEISLQNVIEDFGPAQQMAILQTKLRDLEMAQFRMTPSLAVLTAEYRNTLAGYLGESRTTRNAQLANKNAAMKISAPETLQRLDTLDARRRAFAFANQVGTTE